MDYPHITLQFLGSGDNFGAGGRLQTSILVQAKSHSFLIDCGTTVLIGMKSFGISTRSIGQIFVTHLHGDHFGGIPFFILNDQFSKRTKPLLIVGPPGTEKRVKQAMEVLYPGSTKIKRKFTIEFIEIKPEIGKVLDNITVTGYPAVHYSGAPALIFRFVVEGKVITYTGDTEWTDAIVQASDGADLLIAESYFYEKSIPFHLNYKTLLKHKQEINAKMIVLTHLGEDMLEHLSDVSMLCANDGMKLVI